VCGHMRHVHTTVVPCACACGRFGNLCCSISLRTARHHIFCMASTARLTDCQMAGCKLINRHTCTASWQLLVHEGHSKGRHAANTMLCRLSTAQQQQAARQITGWCAWPQHRSRNGQTCHSDKGIHLFGAFLYLKAWFPSSRCLNSEPLHHARQVPVKSQLSGCRLGLHLSG
jgi:hypothetical protein